MPKLAFLLPEQVGKVGKFHLLYIKLLPSFMEKFKTPNHYLTPKKAITHYRSPVKFDHKGTKGHLLLMAGIKGKMGVAKLIAKAALRSGLGKLSLLTSQCRVDIWKIIFLKQ